MVTPPQGVIILVEIAEDAVEKSRQQVAQVINASAKEIVFTSGATESNNLALQGAANMYREKRQPYYHLR